MSSEEWTFSGHPARDEAEALSSSAEFGSSSWFGLGSSESESSEGDHLQAAANQAGIGNDGASVDRDRESEDEEPAEGFFARRGTHRLLRRLGVGRGGGRAGPRAEQERVDEDYG